MKRLFVVLAISLVGAASLSTPAQAAFGLNSFDVTFLDKEGDPAQAGTHPFTMTTTLGTNFDEELIPDGWVKDIFGEQVPGRVVDTTAYPRCTTQQFLEKNEKNLPLCPPESQVGIIAISLQHAGEWQTFPVFNLTPPPGVLLRLGFVFLGQKKGFLHGAAYPSPPHHPPLQRPGRLAKHGAAA